MFVAGFFITDKLVLGYSDDKLTKRQAMEVRKVEEHIGALCAITEAINEHVWVMPDTEHTQNLARLVDLQQEIVDHVMLGKHYGTDRLNDAIRWAEDKRQALKHNQE